MLNERKAQFQDLTDDEKGAILLALHERRTIQLWCGRSWSDNISIHLEYRNIYRIKPEPVTQKVTLFGQDFGDGPVWVFRSVHTSSDTHKLTYDVVDNKLCNPVFEKLEKSDD